MKGKNLQENICKVCGKCCQRLGKFAWLEFYANQFRVRVGSYVLSKLIDNIYWWAFRQNMKHKKQGCMFLKKKNNRYKCFIYSIRPLMCREFYCEKIT